MATRSINTFSVEDVLKKMEYEEGFDEKHIPFAESPLDAWRGENRPTELKKKPGRKRKQNGPVRRSVGRVQLTFN
jgi:hypothetical protein